MILESNDFRNNELLDKKFTCDGEDFSPHLKWKDPPEDTQSYALTFFRRDPDQGIIFHWRIYNIPKTVTEIEQDGEIPGLQIPNDFYTRIYEGPNATGGIQKYTFRIYALDVETLEGLNKQNFLRIIKLHSIEYADLIALYERKSTPKSSDSCSGCNVSNQF
jgi:hypothetical protein